MGLVIKSSVNTVCKYIDDGSLNLFLKLLMRFMW